MIHVLADDMTTVSPFFWKQMSVKNLRSLLKNAQISGRKKDGRV